MRHMPISSVVGIDAYLVEFEVQLFSLSFLK